MARRQSLSKGSQGVSSVAEQVLDGLLAPAIPHLETGIRALYSKLGLDPMRVRPLEFVGSEADEAELLTGIFPWGNHLPLLTDLVSRRLLEILVRGYQRKTGFVANILDSTGFIVGLEQRVDEYDVYHVVLRSTLRGAIASVLDDRQHALSAVRQLRPITYTGHGYLRCVAAPIYILPREDAKETTGMPLALLFVGQRKVESYEADEIELAELAAQIEVDPRVLIAAYRDLAVTTEAEFSEAERRAIEIADELSRLATREFHRRRREMGNSIYQRLLTNIDEVFRQQVAVGRADAQFLWRMLQGGLVDLVGTFNFDGGCILEQVKAEKEKGKYSFRARALHLGGGKRGRTERAEFAGDSTFLDLALQRRSRRIISVRPQEHPGDAFLGFLASLMRMPLEQCEFSIGLPTQTTTLSGTLALVRERSRHSPEFHRLIDRGNEELLISIVRDVATTIEVTTAFSQLEQAQNSIREKIRELEKLQANRQTLVTVIAHQIMAPIHTAEMYIALLDKDIQQVDARKYREHLTILRRQTQIVEHRVRSFINYTKTLDTGIAKQLFGKSPWQRGTDRVDLPELVREVVREISSFAQVNKLDFNVSVRTPQGRPFPVVIGAYEELKDVVVNLAHNAIKYSLDGSRVNINLTVERNFAVMTMENIGVPIPLAERERIFEFSYRTAEARALRTAGTGIGLAITRSIVENHGGMIQLKGSEFWDRREGRNYNRNTFEVRLPL